MISFPQKDISSQGFHGSCRANLWTVSGSYSIEICYWGRNTNKWLNGLWYEKRLSSAIFKINLVWEKSKVEWNLIQRIRLAANRIWWRCGWSLAKKLGIHKVVPRHQYMYQSIYRNLINFYSKSGRHLIGTIALCFCNMELQWVPQGKL